MSGYNRAGFTLDPTVEIPDEAAPAVGVDAEGMASGIKQASDAQLVVTLSTEAILPAGTVQFTLTPTVTPVGPYTVDWDFGDGNHEQGGDLVQSNVYLPGTYQVRAVYRQAGKTSLDVFTTVTV
jgi:PKD repeat protein